MPPLILIFNVFLTAKPRYHDLYIQPPIDKYIESIRSTDTIYKQQSKDAICLYTLTSLAEIPWDHAIINVTTDKDFVATHPVDILVEIKKLFPNAAISNNRASTRKEYIEIFEGIKNSYPNSYIYFCPNHDHVYVGNSIPTLSHYVGICDAIRKRYRVISRLCYSHQLENALVLRQGSPIQGMHMTLRGNIVEENDEYILVQRNRYTWDSYYISHIDDLLAYYYLSSNEGYCPRGEDCFPYPFPEFRNVVIIPKRKICDHYDGYYHTFGHKVFEDFNDKFVKRIPPLFIPSGFFESDIWIRYGYYDTLPRWVNIHPSKGSYSCHEPTGMDIRCRLDQLPTFWKKRITRIDVNPEYVESANIKLDSPILVEDQNPFFDISAVNISVEKMGYDHFNTFKYNNVESS